MARVNCCKNNVQRRAGEQMAKVRGTRGYSSYRGRRNGKKWLAALLALVLLAACGFLATQRYIVYEADGSFRFELPWKQQKPTHWKSTSFPCRPKKNINTVLSNSVISIS